MYTSPSPLPRRGPLRLPFSVHIRKLFFLFLSLFSGAPRWTHPVGAGVPDGPHRFSFMPTAGLFRTPMDAPVGAGVPDGPHRFSSTLPAGLFRTPMDAPRRGRRPRRPASFFFHAYGGDISRSGATSFCPRRQKDAKTPPKTHGLWNSFRPLAITAQKGPTTNRLYFYPRCRSHAPHGGAMFSQYKKSAAQGAAHTLAAGGSKCAI